MLRLLYHSSLSQYLSGEIAQATLEMSYGRHGKMLEALAIVELNFQLLRFVTGRDDGLRFAGHFSGG